MSLEFCIFVTDYSVFIQIVQQLMKSLIYSRCGLAVMLLAFITKVVSRLTVDSLSTSSRASLQSIYAPYPASSTYHGPVFRLRRSSADSATFDFFWDGKLYCNSGGVVTYLTDWLSPSYSAYVAVWYDQSGNGRNATQTTTTQQPKYDVTNSYVDFRTAAFLSVSPNILPSGNGVYSYVVDVAAVECTTTCGIFAVGGTSTNTATGLYRYFTSGASRYWAVWFNNDASLGIYADESIVSETYDLSNRRGYINGALQTTSAFTSHNMVPSLGYIGKSTDSYSMNGELRYLVTSNIVLPTVDRLLLEGIGQPTSQPTRQPSRQPSSQPSTQPTRQPTSQPVSRPTVQPSLQPSSQPSVQPISKPTRRPTSQPSCHPTCQPSSRPSLQPSGHPTVQPSAQPSEQPSSHPTLQPFSKPSNQPSARPTIQPSVQPTRQPSTTPSSVPSAHPFCQPSCQPSNQPSRQPNSIPTRQPSRQPTGQPSLQPAVKPTCQPSSRPSGQPSSPPTSQPSCQPSSLPSNQPTDQPSRQPTCQPTRKPSLQPFSHPSSQPSSQPTSQPTIQPSTKPSSQPTTQSSRQPSNHPTRQPTVQPSRQPTLQPTGRPSFQPSARPSIQPSTQPSGQPTCQPSCQPTFQPSGQPVSLPSGQPNSRPSSQPSRVPTSQPSVKPSSQPFSQPSRQPSKQPITQPSGQPSVQPSSQPLSHPSSNPSVQPSQQPSHQPASMPSAFPTEQPRARPSNQPSTQPSLHPTRQPTNQPTVQPNAQPSMQPSGLPTCKPSTQPFGHPSKQPTSLPSLQPSSQPIERPSNQPTSQPSDQPTGHPTGQPMALPTAQPNGQPSKQPTRQPSAFPTSQPSDQPIGHPSLQPIVQPSSRPSRYPSCQPSMKPSLQPSSQPSSQPTCHPTTPDRIMRATLPGSMLSVIGVPQFRIILQFFQVILAKTGSAFTDVHLPVVGSFGTYALFQRDSLRNNSLLVATRDAYPLANALSFDSRGRSAAVLRDINGDGYDDFIIGDPFLSKCYVLFGSMNGLTNMTSGFTIIGALDGDLTGWSVSGAGDVNNDTIPDIIVGAPNAMGVGAFYVIYGRRDFVDVYLRYLESWEGFVVYGARKSDFLGVAVSDAGDVNGDKCDDVIVGAVATADYNAGAAYVFYGSANASLSSTINQLSLSQACKFSGVSYQFVGISVSGVGDVNKDGFADVIIGSSPSRASLSLSAFIVYGSATLENGLLLSLTANEGITIVGGGAIVGRNGLGEVLIGISSIETISTGIIVFTNVTIEKPTESPTVAPTVVPTVKSTRFPTLAKTALPSITNITDVPTSMFVSETPTLEPTREPTESPTTSPSIEPSSMSPTIALTSAPSESPTVRPTAVPSTGHPTQVELTRLPFRLPTIAPSNYSIPTVVEHLIDGTTRLVNDSLSSRDTWYLVNATGYVSITPTRGRCTYFIVPASNMTLVIDRFNVSSDLIDLTLFVNVHQYSDLSIASGPVIITLPGDQTIHIMNPNPITLRVSNFVFNVPTANKTDESNSKSVPLTIVVSMSIVAIVGLLVLWRWYYLKRKRINDLLNRKCIGMYNTDQFGVYIFEESNDSDEENDEENSVNLSDYTIESSGDERMEEGSESVFSGQALLSAHTIDSDGEWRAKEPGIRDDESKSEEMHDDSSLKFSDWNEQGEQEWHDHFDHSMQNANARFYNNGYHNEGDDIEAPRREYYQYYIGNNHIDESY